MEHNNISQKAFCITIESESFSFASVVTRAFLFIFLKFFYKFVLLNTEAFTLTPCSFPYEKKFIFYGSRKKKPIFIQFPYILCEHFKYFSPSLINEPSLLYIYMHI